MRILHVLDHSIPLQSGYTFRTRNILLQQRVLGWETWHVTSPKHYGSEGRQEEEVDGLRFYRSKPVPRLVDRLPVVNQLAVVLQLKRRIDELVRRLKPDVLHAHSPALNGLAALRVGHKHGIPVVYEVRAFWEDAAVNHGTSRAGGLRYRLTRALETYVLRHSDAVTTICQGLKTDIVSRGIPENRITVIPNAVDADNFTMRRARDTRLARQLGFADNPVLGFIGSFYAYEGLTLLLRAMPSILQTRPDIRLLLVGGGPQEADLKSLSTELHLEDRVVFTGRVPHDQVQRYYDLVDILVYPRLQMRLTELVTPLKPLEAMAQGKLVLASDVGGHRELIRSGETGELFAAGDPQALANGVLALLEQRGDWERRQRNGRRFVEDERNWPASVGRYAPVYERLTGIID